MPGREVTKAKAIVFWDIEDYKIPDGLDAGEVSKNIKEDFADVCHRGAVSITAYADETNQIQDDVFHSAGIKLERIQEGPKGKNRSRDIAILSGMLASDIKNLFSDLENPESSLTIMVISDNTFTSAVEDLKQRNHNVLFKSLSAEGKPITKTRRSSAQLCPSCEAANVKLLNDPSKGFVLQ